MSEAFCQTQLLVLRPLKLTLPKLKKNGLSDYQVCHSFDALHFPDDPLFNQFQEGGAFRLIALPSLLLFGWLVCFFMILFTQKGHRNCLPSCLGAPRSERQCISRCSHDLSIRHRDLAGGPVYHHADCICWDLGLHQHVGVSNTYEIMYRFDKVCRHITIATCLICFFPRLEVKH